jgi:hypothetical protein
MCFETECTISGYRSCENSFVTQAFILLHWTQNEDWECFSTFSIPSECKKMQNLCFWRECTIWGTEIANLVSWPKHPFYSIGPKMIIWSVLEHFRNLRKIKWCKTCVSSLDALFFFAPKLQRSFRNKSIHSTPMDPKSLRVFWSILETFGMKKDSKHPKWWLRHFWSTLQTFGM